MAVSKKFLVFAAFLALASAVPTEHVEPVDVKESPVETLLTDMKKCKNSDDTLSCVAVNTLSSLEEVAAKPSIEIMPGVTLESENPDSQRSSRKLNDIEMPTKTEEKLARMIDMMFDVVSNLFNGRTLKIRIPESASESMSRALEEGRKKMKRFKMMNPLMLALAAKLFAVVPLAIGGLFLLATKAAIIAKIALVLALVVGVPSLLSGGGGGLFNKGANQGGWNGGWTASQGTSSYYPSSQWSTGGPYKRSAQDLAYEGQKP